MSPNPRAESLRVLLDWSAQLTLTEVDASMRARLVVPQTAQMLREAEPAISTWLELDDAAAILETQEAYAATFLLPSGPGARLGRAVHGDTERMGPHLEHEIHTLLDALRLGPDAQRFGSLPKDHVSVSLSALGALIVADPPIEVQGLAQAHFVQALLRWSQSLATHDKAHPLYRGLGVIIHNTVQDLLDDQADAKSPGALRLPVLN